MATGGRGGDGGYAHPAVDELAGVDQAEKG
jgi:hypothetical protein